MTPEEAAAAMPHVRAAVAAGLLPFPVKLIAGQKKPAHTGWQSKVWDLGMLEQALLEPKCFGYGLTLPKADPRRLVDLDLDDGGEGLQPGQAPWQERLAAVESEFGPMPATKTTETPSGGQHRWFLWPDEVPLPGGSWHGFTVRMLHGSKNYVVGPGSVRDGKPYVNVAPGTPIATMPTELARSGVKAKASGAEFIEIKPAYELPETIDHGDCHLEVCRYTLSLWGRRHSIAEMWTLVRYELGPRLATAHTDEHLRQHFDSATADLATKYPRDDAGYPVLNLSPEPREPSGRNLSESFTTPVDLMATLPTTIEWTWTQFVAYGALHELVGAAKAAGKTTLLAYLIAALLDGAPFLGQPTTRGPVVFLTEQPTTSLRAVLERAGLTGRRDLSILLWRDTRGSPWAEIVVAAVAECVRVGSRVLIVDTLPQFAGLRGDAENDAGAALAAIEPLQIAAADGLAVIVVRHERKGGGEVGESGRGSSALTGSVDVVLRLARQPNSVRPTIRVLSALSRFDETPPELVIDLTDTGYVALGDVSAVAFDEARSGVLAALADASDGLTEQEIADVTNGKKTTVGAALRHLLSTGDVARTGAGKRGDPFRYIRGSGVSGFVSPVLPMGETVGESNPGPDEPIVEPVDLWAEAQRIFGDDLLQVSA